MRSSGTHAPTIAHFLQALVPEAGEAVGAEIFCSASAAVFGALRKLKPVRSQAQQVVQEMGGLGAGDRVGEPVEIYLIPSRASLTSSTKNRRSSAAACTAQSLFVAMAIFSRLATSTGRSLWVPGRGGFGDERLQRP